MTIPVRDVSTADFPVSVVARSKEVPVVVDFWAAWCGPCRVLGPILERAAAEANGEWELAKVDVDQNQQLAAQFGVQGIPTVIGFRDGEPVARFTGALPEPSVREWLRQLVPSEADRLAEEAAAARHVGDNDGAERLFVSALEHEPAHPGAVVGLADILIERGSFEEALGLLGRVPPTSEVERLRSLARTRQGAGDLSSLEATVESNPDDHAARLTWARALAAAGHNERALDEMLTIVGGDDPDIADEARQAMLDLFEVIEDAELVQEYRRRLANLLF